jgi:hypothetical protein
MDLKALTQPLNRCRERSMERDIGETPSSPTQISRSQYIRRDPNPSHQSIRGKHISDNASDPEQTSRVEKKPKKGDHHKP